MAEKLKPGQVCQLLCILSVFFFLFVLSVNVSADVDSQKSVSAPEDKTTNVWLTKIRQSGKSYWAKLRETLNRGQSHFFPPNTYFTGKDDGAAMGAGEKMRDAATRSFENSKGTVEEAARSAAEAVSDTAEAVKEKVKRTVSGGVKQQPEGSEEL